MQKITKLNNNGSLRVSLYENGGKGLGMLDGCRVKGHVQTDGELVGTFTEIVRRISN